MKGKHVHRDRWGQEIGTTTYNPSAAEVGAQIGGGLAVAYGLWKGLSLQADAKAAEYAVQALIEGRYDEAINRANLLLRKYPQEADVYVLRGTAYGRAGRIDDAIADLTKALQLNSNLERALASRAYCYGEKMAWGNAIRDLSDAIQINPNEHTHWCWRGIALRHIGDLDQSLYNLSQAISLNPGNDINYLERATTHLERKELDNVVADCSRAIKLAPDNPQGYRIRSEAYKLQGNTSSSDMDTSQAITLERQQDQRRELENKESVERAKNYTNKRISSSANWCIGLAIASWCLLPVILAIPAIICGHTALSEMKKEGIGTGKGVAIAGLVLGYLNIAAICLVYFLAMLLQR